MLRYSLLFLLLVHALLLTAQRLDSIRGLPDTEAKARLLQEAAQEQVKSSNKLAKPIYREALQLADRLELPALRADLQLATGGVYTALNDADSASMFLTAALDYFQRADKPERVVETYLKMSFNAVLADQDSLAIALAQRADSLSLRIGYTRGRIQAMGATANVYISLNDRTAFRRYFEEALKLAREAGEDGPIANMAFQLADDAYRYNELDRVGPLAREAQAAARRLDLTQLERRIVNTLALTRMMQNDYQASERLFDTLLQMRNGEPSIGLLANRSMLYQRMGREEEAARDLRTAMDQLLKTKNRGTLNQVYAMAANQFAARGRYDSAYHYSMERYRLRDTTLREMQSAQVAEAETRYQTARKEAEIERQALTLERQRFQLYATAGGLLLALAAVAVFVVLSRRLRRRSDENAKLAAEKETLIGEIHHRVKNNLQVISSLLQLQSRGLDEDDTRARHALRESQSRVQAMGLIHQKLYQTDTTSVRMPEYLRDLGDTLIETYRLDERVEMYYDVAPIELDVDTAIPLGLIINELVTNSLKYAFPDGREGTIEISLYREEERLHLRVTDDGVGTYASSAAQGGTSFGTRLVDLLAKKLGGQVRTPVAERGHVAEIEIDESVLAV